MNIPFVFIPAPKYCVLFQYLILFLKKIPFAKTYMHQPAMYLMNDLELNIKYRKREIYQGLEWRVIYGFLFLNILDFNP